MMLLVFAVMAFYVLFFAWYLFNFIDTWHDEFFEKGHGNGKAWHLIEKILIHGHYGN